MDKKTKDFGFSGERLWGPSQCSDISSLGISPLILGIIMVMAKKLSFFGGLCQKAALGFAVASVATP